ncbi:MAG: sulfurtransferase [Jaaginema sp. PMC 1079.18]|nr:sulfurtransferase [Jaaginema sp. PMC 1080.18]MEC4852705.1 sulfurtransferase [Jaaginema sp. PMC 1079.18]MEC4867880.1 sulfurtransferase [Jaaginema sp. PMC 1078.18]
MTQNYVVSATGLASQLDNPQVVVIDCRFALADSQLGQRQYQESHIRGAYYLDLEQDLSAPVREHGGRHPLPNIDQFTAKLAVMGINFRETWVIAYDDSNFAFAARLWWLLRYLGHDRVSVLDGGWSAWVQGNYPTTTAIPTPKKGYFSPQIQEDWIVDLEGVKQRQNLNDTILVDSRDRDRYLGEREPIDPIAGHIPGAVNLPWKTVSDATGYIQPSDIQKQRWTALNPPEEIIVYCGSGVTACVNLLSLALAGIPNGKLYPGSWSDWCSYL